MPDFRIPRPGPAVALILVTLTLDAIGFGLILPVMPALLQEVSGGDLAQAALWAGVMTGGFAVMQVLTGPVLGNLSDRFGRKPVLLVSLGVLALIPLSSLGGLVIPALRAELSDRTPSAQQGELQGAMASIRAVGMVAAPLVFTTVFAAYSGAGAWADLPGAPFALAAALNLGVLALLARARLAAPVAPGRRA